MQRKVIKQGNNTLTITLPRKWAQKVNLQSGDALEVTEKQEGLFLSPFRSEQRKSRTVDLGHFDLLIPRVIYALYKKGYDELVLSYPSKQFLPLIQKAMGKETIGYEIVKQGEKQCEVKIISEVLVQEFDMTLRRIFLTLQFMAQEGLQAITEENMEQLKQCQELEETNNRLTTFCRRTINKYGHKDEENIPFLYYLIETLEKIADEYKYLYSFVLENKGIRLSAETKKVGEQVNSMIVRLSSLFYDFEPQKAVELAQLRKTIVKDAHHLFTKKKHQEQWILHHMIIIAQEIFTIVDPLIAMKL